MENNLEARRSLPPGEILRVAIAVEKAHPRAGSCPGFTFPAPEAGSAVGNRELENAIDVQDTISLRV